MRPNVCMNLNDARPRRVHTSVYKNKQQTMQRAFDFEHLFFRMAVSEADLATDCCVSGCKLNRRKCDRTKDGISFHVFPSNSRM